MVTQTLRDFEDLNIDASFQYLKKLSVLSFKRLVKTRIKEYAFLQLSNKKEKHSKLGNLKYNGLKMQNYLYDRDTSVEEKITAFKWRTHMADHFGENFRGGRERVTCPHCLSHPDSQELSYTDCIFTKQHSQAGGPYSNIFNETIQPRLIRSICKITNQRKQ